MVLVMIEVADLEVQEQIKKMDAAYTWPHPTDKGYFVSAVFVRTNENKPYLIYCPKISSNVTINEENYSPFAIWGDEPIKPIRKLELTQGMASVNGAQFLVIPLEQPEPKKIKKEEIEKLFGIKVV